MNNLSVQSNINQGVTMLPNDFIDTCMAHANGEFLKIYLYLLRWSKDQTTSMTLATIADTFFMTENDVLRALRYWEKENLLNLTFGPDRQLTSIVLCDFNVPDSKQPDTIPAVLANNAVTRDILPSKQLSDYPPATTPATTDSCEKPNYPMVTIQNFMKTCNGDELFLVIQQYLGKPLSQTDINTIVFFHEQLKMTADFIEYLFEYCVSNGHRSMRYIETVAISWNERNIRTIDDAKNNAAYYSKASFAVLKAFGIRGRNPASEEVRFIDKWMKEDGFDLPLILEACNRTIQSIHSPSFKYADSILKNWKENRVIGLNDVKALDLAHANAKLKSKVPASDKAVKKPSSNKFHNFNQRSYDYSKLEKTLAKKIQATTND